MRAQDTRELEQPAAESAAAPPAKETEQSSPMADYASNIGNQAFAGQVARSPAQVEDVKPGDTAPAPDTAAEPSTQDVKPGEGAAAAEPAASAATEPADTGAAEAAGAESAEGESEQTTP